MEYSVAIPQKIKNRVTMWFSNPSSGCLLEKLENIYLKRYIHPYVHCSIIHGSQDMETTKVSFDRVEDWIKKNVVHVNNGILPNHKKRWNTAICGNIDEPWEYYAEKNESQKPKTIWFHSYVGNKTETHEQQTSVWWVWWLTEGREVGV